MDKIHWGALAGSVMMAGVAGAADMQDQDLQRRLEALEKQVQELSASAGSGLPSAFSLGGYGEMHYNNLSGKGGASDKEELDFHRFVLFFGYDYTEHIHFRSEVEIEHAVTGGDEPGEVELEQAYVDFDLNDRHSARAGLFLLPVGLLNSTHEPPCFYGVERNPVENKILPTTWWEGGAGFLGFLDDGWRYETYLHSGLETSADSLYAVRDGRQKGASALASDLAATAALNWSRPGLTLGASIHHQTDVTQGQDPDAGSAWLGDLHAELRKEPFGLRAVFAQWQLEGDGPEAVGADRQFGWYVEPSYRLTEKWGVFARYNKWDNQAGSGEFDSEKTQVDTGLNYWPVPQVVVKADYQWQDNDNGKDQNGFNLGLGYEF
jgi:hypothetical protein